MVLDALLTRLIHYAYHYVGEDAKLEEETKLNTEIEGAQDVLLAQVKDKCHSFEAMREEGGQVVIELAVNNFQVILEVGTKVVDVKKDLLEILLDDGQYACQLDITKAGNDVISDCMILIPD